MLIERYKFKGMTFYGLCKHNELAAREANCEEAAGVWRILPNMLEMNQKYYQETMIDKAKIKDKVHMDNKKIVMKYKEEVKTIKETKSDEEVSGLIIKTHKKSLIPLNASIKAEHYLTKLPSSIQKQKQFQSVPKMKIVALEKSDKVIEDMVLEMLREQIQYFSDKNDIVTAATLAVILWKRINLPQHKLHCLIIEYKGIIEMKK